MTKGPTVLAEICDGCQLWSLEPTVGIPEALRARQQAIDAGSSMVGLELDYDLTHLEIVAVEACLGRVCLAKQIKGDF